MKDNIITTLVLLICLLCFLTIYLIMQLEYTQKELEHQQIKYEILIKEPRVKNIIESGG